MLKQRLDTGSSVSYYSRLSLQQEVGQQQDTYRKLTLNNNLEVIVFNPSVLKDIIAHANEYFTNITEYVAIGSKRRREANLAFRVVSDRRTLDFVLENCSNDLFLNTYQNTFKISVKDILIQLYKEDFFKQNRTAFLKYDSIEDYPDYKTIHSTFHDLDYNQVIWLEWYFSKISNLFSVLSQKYIEEHIPKQPDYESKYVNREGKLTRICNPELLKKLHADLGDPEYTSMASALCTVFEFYGDRFPNMELGDWYKLLDKIDWTNYNTYAPADAEDESYLDDDYEDEDNDDSEIDSQDASERSRPRHFFFLESMPRLNLRRFILEAVKLIVTKLDEPYEEMKQLFPLRSSGNALFVDELEFEVLKEDQKRRYFNASDEVFADREGTTFYLSNQWKIEDAEARMFPIFTKYGLNWGEVGNDGNRIPTGHRPPTGKEPNRKPTMKLVVEFSGGAIVDYNKVSDTFVETIRRIGPERVYRLSIPMVGHHLVTKYLIPGYERACKPLGDGYYVCTNSGTPQKYEQLMQIKQMLHLDDVRISLEER